METAINRPLVLPPFVRVCSNLHIPRRVMESSVSSPAIVICNGIVVVDGRCPKPIIKSFIIYHDFSSIVIEFCIRICVRASARTMHCHRYHIFLDLIINETE